MKILIKIGNLIAIFLMFLPIVIVACYDRFKSTDFCFLFLCSIFYDIYYYTVIDFDNYMDKQKKLYDDVKNGKTIESKTTEQKEKWFQVIGITTIEEYFKNK